MDHTIQANVTEMFSSIEPWYVSNSVANLGPRAAELTWANALEIARAADEWLLSDRADACEAMQEWAREAGAWDREEIAAWSDAECLGLFVQNIASDLREHLGADDHELEECARVYKDTDWEHANDSPRGWYELKSYNEDDGEIRVVTVEYYAGI